MTSHTLRVGLGSRLQSLATMSRRASTSGPSLSARSVISPSRRALSQSRLLSLILISPNTEPSSGQNFKVLLLRRSSAGSFIGAHVFPGGNADKTDFSSQWAEILGSEDDAQIRALKVCALREAFEECGILLESGKREPLKDRAVWRNDVCPNN